MADIAKVGSGVKNVAVGIAVLTATAAAAWIAYKLYKGAGDAADTLKKVVTEDLNPASDKNLAYQAAGALVGCADGSCSLGTRIYDGVEWFNSLWDDIDASPSNPTQPRDTRTSEQRAADDAAVDGYLSGSAPSLFGTTPLR